MTTKHPPRFRILGTLLFLFGAFFFFLSTARQSPADDFWARMTQRERTVFLRQAMERGARLNLLLGGAEAADRAESFPERMRQRSPKELLRWPSLL